MDKNWTEKEDAGAPGYVKISTAQHVHDDSCFSEGTQVCGMARPAAATSGDAPTDPLSEAEILEALGTITEGTPKRLPLGWAKFASAIERKVLARIESAAAPAPSEYRKLTGDLTLKELAAEFCAVADLGGDVTLSAGACRKLFDAMTTPPVAVPATASGDESITDKDAPGYRPPCCDGAKDGSPCCSEGVCEADRELAEMGIPVISAAVSAATKPAACVLPPTGWTCTRTPGHEGPCAAVPTEVCADDYTPEQMAIYQHGVEDGKLVARGMERYNAGVAAREAATKPTADLSSLTRYEPSVTSGMGEAFADMDENTAGDYVLLADVQSLLATKPAAAPAMPDALTMAGALMANTMFNLAQRPGYVITEQLCASMKDMQSKWDKAVRSAPAASITGAAQTAEQVRDQALEEAAVACDSYAHAAMPQYRNDANGALCCARNIRALKHPTPTHSSEAGK